jgi:cellulose synthase/poly-beta-1,6-N-acetylglucosamine synthase-like glycosyltransferase
VKNKIAVLQALYDGDKASWTEQSLKSIINQDYGFDNINYYLCVDGPIGRDLKTLIDSFGKYFKKIVVNEKNQGLAKCLNMLITSLEDEDLVFRMDSDDISLPDRFSKQIQMMTDQQEIGICGTSIIEIDNNGKQKQQRNYYQTHEQVLKNMYKSTAVGHPTVCFRRSALDLLKGYNESMKFSQDIDFWFKAMLKGIKFYNIQEPLLLYRTADSFYYRRSVNKAFNEFRIFWSGCNRLYGFSWRNIYPILRVLFRLAPLRFSYIVYSSGIRKMLFRK